VNSDVEEIKNRLNIVDVLRDYIRLEKAGANWRALCPFHNEKSPSFMISEERQSYHCFGCQKGGDIFSFVMEMEGLEFRDALKQLAEKAGIELKTANPKFAAEKNKTLEILEMATKFYQAHLLQTASGKKIINYLKERGLNDESIQTFRLGYAPDGWRNTISFLEKKGYKLSEIEKTGLLVKKESAQISNSQFPISNQVPISNDQNTKYQIQNTRYYDRFRDRIMFPIADTNGKIVGYSARVAPGGDETQAKYVNTPETEVYHKSKILYGIDKAKQEMRQKDSVLLVEGNMDVIASAQAGIKNTVAVSGTALTLDQINIIKRYTDKVKMFFDMDSAGEQATKKSIKLCFEKEMDVRVVKLPEGKDAAELAQKNPEELKMAVEQASPAMEYFFDKVLEKNDKEKVQDKKVIALELLDMIDNMTNAIEKSHWIKKLGDTLGVEESILTDMLKQATLRDRITKKSSSSPRADVFIPRKKLEILLEDLIGLMLVSPGVWEAVTEKERLNALFLKDSLLSVLLENGKQFHFNFDDFLKSSFARDIKEEIEKIYFEKKYRLGLNNELEEILIDDPVAEAERCLKEIRKESKKEELEKIICDLQIAEKEGDREAAKILRTHTKKILEEINQLA